MLRRLARTLLFSAALLLSANLFAQTAKVSLEPNETIFSVLAAANACGYDQELAASDSMRQQVRSEMAANADKTPEARVALQELCRFYRDHQQPDPSRDLAQYVSLALNLGSAPQFELTVKEADLPPDASYVLGFVPLLRTFYNAVGLQEIWMRHRGEYAELLDQFHEQVSKTILGTDVYLKSPVSGYVGRRFAIYIEPLAAPSQINARNYGVDYFMVVSPDNGKLNIDKIRHTYLHFALDPLAMKRANALRRLEPLLYSVRTAPLSEAYKHDVSLLLTESLIRAVEARMLPGKSKEAERQRQEAAYHAAAEGFILAPYYLEQLADFEKTPESINERYGEWLRTIDIKREEKRANDTPFVKQTEPEVVRAQQRPYVESPLDAAEKRLSAGDVAGAREVADAALANNTDDPAHAYFVLARVASLEGKMADALNYFQRTVQASKSARLLAWSHIYLGRIFDLKGERDQAVQHYRAALDASKQPPTVPGAGKAAESGLKAPYEPPVSRPEVKADDNKLEKE